MIVKLGYSGRYWTELGKVEGFPKIEAIDMVIDSDRFGSEWKEFLLKNVELRDLLIKIGNEVFDDDYDVYEDMYCTFSIHGDFNKEKNNAYFHVTGDSQIVFYENLDMFSEGYKTEEEWGVEEWKVI